MKIHFKLFKRHRKMQNTTRLKLFYWDHPFILIQEENTTSITGKLLLDENSRKLLEKLLEQENKDDWYLDKNGYRLDEKELFEKSPWSMENSNGKIKLLCRMINFNTDETLLNTPDTYIGELFV